MSRTLALVAVLALVIGRAVPASAAQSYNVVFHSFPLAAADDQLAGTRLANGSVVLAASGLQSELYSDSYGNASRTYLFGTWTSPWFSTGFGFTELVSSWNADTPAGTWIEILMRAHGDKGDTKWYVMGRWAYDDSYFLRTSLGGQGDPDGYIAIDTFFAKDHPMTSYQLQAKLLRSPASSATPRLDFIGAVSSDAPNLKPYVPSPLGGAEGIELAVPRYSQEIHAGEYPGFDGGGEAWCSPTSTSMIVAYWGTGPQPADYAYVGADYPKSADRWVDYAARYVFDYHYQGAGNWPFNAAYAAHFGLRGFVTQLRSLNEAERFIGAGIPLVASLAFSSNKLPGFLFKSTNGHLLTIVGFTATGDVISNDPASASDATVRHVYPRQDFERDWLSSTGGIVYVIRPASLALPAAADPSQPNW